MKTVSLELAKQLKEAEFPQRETAFYWHTFLKSLEYLGVPFEEKSMKHFIAAPTADEILDQLPESIEDFELDDAGENYGLVQINIWKDEGKYFVNYCDEDNYPVRQEGQESLADATGKIWLSLKENNLL